MANYQDIMHFLIRWVFVPAISAWSIGIMIDHLVQAYKEKNRWKRYFCIFTILILLTMFFSIKGMLVFSD